MGSQYFLPLILLIASTPAIAALPKICADLLAQLAENPSVSLVNYLDEIPLLSLSEVTGAHNAERKYHFAAGSELVTAAHRNNVEGVKGKFRKDGSPYADHPVRLAMFLRRALGDKWSKADVEMAMSEALLHDYLEEGVGVSVESFRDLRTKLLAETRDADFSERVARSAVVLTEAELDLKTLTGLENKDTLKEMEKIVLVKQIALWAKANSPQARTTLAAAFSDKLTNLFDLGYIVNNPKLDPAQRADKLAAYIASIEYALQEYGQSAKLLKDSSGGLDLLVESAKHALRLQKQRFKVDSAAVDRYLNHLTSLWTTHEGQIQPAISARLDSF
jgi:hypothetical protein